MDDASRNNLAIYIFSFNRGKFLSNCLQSVDQCAPGFDITLIDDQSSDPTTQAILSNYRPHYRFIEADKDKDPEHKTGGLYNNMRFAFRDARDRGKSYILFLQDDMQLVRPIMDDDLDAATRFFKANPNAAELHTCFMKRFFANRDEAWVALDESGEAYLRPTDYPGYSGFSAVGLFSIERFDRLFDELQKGEYANNEYAQKNNIAMGLSARPFMMWLPYPISYRGKERNIPLQLIEGIGGCGYYPYSIMDEQEISALLHRDRSTQKPYAEDWLFAPSLGNVSFWSFAGGMSNLYARGGLRARLASLLQRFR